MYRHQNCILMHTEGCCSCILWLLVLQLCMQLFSAYNYNLDRKHDNLAQRIPFRTLPCFVSYHTYIKGKVYKI